VPAVKKRVFLTGASGFIGAHVARQLTQNGHKVAVLLRTEAPGHRLEELSSTLSFIRTHGSDIRSLESELRAWAPDCMLHLGWGGVGNRHRNDCAVQLENVQYSVSLANLCAAVGAKQFIGAGSQAEYGPRNCLITEDLCPSPTTLYGAAKLSAALLTQRICDLAGVRHAWLRVFSTYGPGDDPDWMLPALIRQLLQRKRPQLTACEQTWDYLHVTDAAAAFVAAVESSVEGICNLASGREVQLRSVVEMVRDLVDPDAKLGIGEIPYRPDQVMRMQVCTARLSMQTGFTPSVSLQDGLRHLVESMRQNFVAVSS
jgi:UDP-glucose 4-epimerase